MPAAALKKRIQALPDGDFVKAWECIDAINAALAKAGPAAAPLALGYVRAVQEEGTAARIAELESEIARLTKKTKRKA